MATEWHCDNCGHRGERDDSVTRTTCLWCDGEMRRDGKMRRVEPELAGLEVGDRVVDLRTGIETTLRRRVHDEAHGHCWEYGYGSLFTDDYLAKNFAPVLDPADPRAREAGAVWVPPADDGLSQSNWKLPLSRGPWVCPDSYSDGMSGGFLGWQCGWRCIAYADTRDAVLAKLADLRDSDNPPPWAGKREAKCKRCGQARPEVDSAGLCKETCQGAVVEAYREDRRAERHRADMERNAWELGYTHAPHVATPAGLHHLAILATQRSAVAKLPAMPPKVVVRCQGDWEP